MTQQPIRLGRRQTPPPAEAPLQPVRLGQPLPPGQLIRPKFVTDGEKKILEAAGWSPNDPIPDNLSETLADLREEISEDMRNPPLPVAANTPPVTYKEVDIQELSAAEQNRTRQVLASVLRQAKQAEAAAADQTRLAQTHDSVREAMRVIDEPVVENDIDTKPFSAPADAAAQSPEPPTDRCARCGWQHGQPDPIKVTEADKDSYMESLLGFRPFTKTVTLYRDRLRVTMRDLTTEELDLCYQQVTKNYQDGKVRTLLDQNEEFTRYCAGLQIIRLEGLSSPVVVPQSASGWAEQLGLPLGLGLLPAIWNSWQDVLVSDSMRRLLHGAVIEFNALLRKLEANAFNPDF